MRLNRPSEAASNLVPAEGHRAGAGIVRTMSVTAIAAAACALSVLPASAATAHAAAKHASKTSVSAKPKTAYTHADVKLSATVKSSGKTPTGTVTFWFGTRKLCEGHLSKASASCEAKFSDANTKTVTGKYSGDATHKASSGTVTVKIVNKPTTPPPPAVHATTTTVTSPGYINTVQGGTPATLTATVASVGGGAVPTGTVSFVPTNLGVGPYPGYIVCNATLVDGTGSCTVDPPTGTWGFVLYEATYTPAPSDTTHTGSVSSGEHKLITPDNTTTTAGPATAAAGTVTLTADIVPYTPDNTGFNILDGYSETGGDTVAFTIGGTPVAGCGAATMTWNGTVNVAQCTTTLGAGTYTVVAAYSGDEYTNPSTSAGETLTVTP